MQRGEQSSVAATRLAAGRARRGLASVAVGPVFFAVLLLAGLVAVQPASAVPSFSRQTGQPCAACHTAFPELTPFGRRFKLSGYTLQGGDFKVPPISALLMQTFTHTQAAQELAAGAGHARQRQLRHPTSERLLRGPSLRQSRRLHPGDRQPRHRASLSRRLGRPLRRFVQAVRGRFLLGRHSQQYADGAGRLEHHPDVGFSADFLELSRRRSPRRAPISRALGGNRSPAPAAICSGTTCFMRNSPDTGRFPSRRC